MFGDGDDGTRRVIVITVCLNERITNHEEGYNSLVNALVNLHMRSDCIRSNDYICYNVGSPLISQFLRSDL